MTFETVPTNRPLPAGYRLRPATMDDLEATVELMNLYSIAQGGVAEHDLEETRAEWEEPLWEAETDSQLVIAPDGRLVGFADVYAGASLPTRPFVSIYVHPECEGQGIDWALMEWGEARARQFIAQVPEELRVSLLARTRTRNEAACRLFEAFGMKPVRYRWKMTIEMDSPPPAPRWPAGIEMEVYDSEKQPLVELVKVVRDSFRDHWGYIEEPLEEDLKRWTHYIEHVPSVDFSLWFLAREGDQLVGAVLCRMGRPEDPQMGWVDILGVRRPWRRQGLGRALLLHAFGEFYRRGQKRAGLNVDAGSLTGATRLYQEAGMSVAHEYVQYEKELRPGKEIATQAVES